MKSRITITALLTIVLIGGIATGSSNLITVTGTVTDEGGTYLEKVCISTDNGSNTTYTDKNGKYTISVRKGSTLTFACDDYITVEYAAPTKSGRLDVVMKPDFAILAVDPLTDYDINDICYEQVECSMVISELAYKTSYQTHNQYYGSNGEEYNYFSENRFISVSSEPLSTFSLDVDAASYSNSRRMINNGHLPPPDAVRIEEFINYFSYDYPNPTGSDPVNIITEVGPCPWNDGNKLVRIGVKAREIPSADLPPSNFVFLIDVSGSMYSRMDMVKSSMKLLVNNLRDNDIVSIVVYASDTGVRLPATPASNKQKIKESIDGLTSGGSTAGGAGILLAYETARANFIQGGNNRIILCTDGDFNVGVSSPTELERLIEKERESGVYLTVLGYGMGNYKDNRIQILAEKGNGNHAYIDNMQEAHKVLVNEFGSTMYSVADDVKIQVEFNPANVEAYRLVGYESRLLANQDFNNDAIDAGELGAGHTVTAIYEIVPAGSTTDYSSDVDRLRYQEPPFVSGNAQFENEIMTVKLRYKNPGEDTSRLMEHVVRTGSHHNSDDFRFASAVAMFGQLLRNSQFKGSATYDDVIALGSSALGEDYLGYRREFIRLAETVKRLQ